MIHQYKLNGYNVVLDVCSGSIHLVDEIAYDLIAGYETENREALIARLAEQYKDKTDAAELNEAWDQLTALKEAGTLFTPDTYEPMAGKLKAKTSGVVKEMTAEPA